MKKSLFVILLALILTACSKGPKRDAEGRNESFHIIADGISNNTVTSFAEDAQGHIWISTDRGLNKYNINEYHQYLSDSTARSVANNRVQEVYRDRRNRLWAATIDGVNLYTDSDTFRKIPIDEISQNAINFFEDNDGRLFLNMNVHLCIFDEKKQRFVSVIHDFDPLRQYRNTCHVDKSNRIWVVNPSLLRCFSASTLECLDSIPLNGYVSASWLDTQKGILYMASGNSLTETDINSRNPAPKEIPFENAGRLAHNTITHIHPYDGRLLIVAGKTMMLLDPKSGKAIPDDDLNFPFRNPGFNVSSLFTDSRGNLWIGSADQGYQTVYSRQDRFNNPLSAFFKNRSVTSLATAGRFLVIATLDNDIYIYDTSSGATPLKTMPLPPDVNVNTIRADAEGNIWLMAEDTLFKAYVSGSGLKITDSYPLRLPIGLAQDRAGTVWVSSYTENIYALRKGEREFTSIRLRPKTFTFTSDLQLLDDGRIMAATFGHPLQFIDPSGMSVTDSRIDLEKSDLKLMLSKFAPTSLFQDKRGYVWIGTVGNGLLRYDAAADSIERIADISCEDICDTREDDYGNIWISTKYGLNKFDYTTGHVSKFFLADGIGGNQFYANCSALLDDGTLLFGGTHGITAFNPGDIRPHGQPTLLFENLRIHNALVSPADGRNIDRILPLNPEIRLNHKENSFSISFAALEYGEHERLHYSYMLEGFDPHWIDAGNNREASYSNLPPGKYIFRVRAINPERDRTEAENSITVKVSAAPWLSWWAKTVYVLLAVLIFWFVWRIFFRIRKEKERARFAEQEKLQEKRVNEMNMRFFANVSHEFRSPLTLISAPLAELSKSDGLPEKERKLVGMVERNADRMRRLINQLLDFHKLENDTLPLQVAKSDVVEVVRGVCGVFRFNASQKYIEIAETGLEESFSALIDTDKIEKIIYNLLSNAMKFTPEGGKVEVAFDVVPAKEAGITQPDAAEVSEYMKITVADTGPGFPENQIAKVFERYYQCEGEGIYNYGTGIGLYYSRKLASIHHGYLSAANRKEGGALMTLLIPASAPAYSENEMATETSVAKDSSASATQTDKGELPPDPAKKNILIVDDDVDIANYIKTLLEKEYNVKVCHDASSALAVLHGHASDLVISDVVMPGKSGFELCGIIKGNPQYCHIPVILLTAKSTVSEQVEGLDSGADAYVTKPFEPAYLLAMVRSMLANRNRLKELLNSTTDSSPIGGDELSPHDRRFIDELYALMEAELDNPEFDVLKALDVLKVSRTKFYYKLKGLTGQTPASFFKIYKLNRAAELIREGKHSISEIADMTGFSTLSHFSTSFRKHFGVAPSDYPPAS